ncbi:MAG: DUF1552 domain-containing protein [Myxococcota bacterium]|nr:DUF1552 domain-containing protein [Myxococcota bacterium]
MRSNSRRLQQIDRRRFLLGAGGAALALPMLEMHSRVARGQSVAPPKRLVLVMHSHGRCAGGRHSGSGFSDIWSPRSNTGALPAEMSPLLAALAPIRDEIVTVDGVDNVVRHMTQDPDGHLPNEQTILTCQLPKADKTAGGASFDYIAGERLRGSPSQRGALVFPATPMDADWRYTTGHFWGVGGTRPTLANSNPAKAIAELFGGTAAPAPSPGPEPEPMANATLADRLVSSRRSILDGVTGSFQSFRALVGASDRARLDQHIDFIRTLETRLGGGSGSGGGPGPLPVGESCAVPSASAVPSYTQTQASRAALDAEIVPYTIENMVMSLACDITRVASLHHYVQYDPIFSSEFSGGSPFVSANWHAAIHDTPEVTMAGQPAITQAYQMYGKLFTRLVQRLGEVTDVDGSRLLDNTLVVWMSDMGYGATHGSLNIPIVMAGMKSAFANGQGRHLVCSERRTTGDFFAQVLRMLGQDDTTFGLTGTLGSTGLSSAAALLAPSDFPDYIVPSLNLHQGELDL